MKTAIAYAICYLGLFACAERPLPPPPPVVKLGPVETKPVFHNLLVYVDAGGLDVFATRETFYERFPDLKRSDGNCHSGYSIGFEFSETMTTSHTDGVYIQGTGMIWVVAKDPAHLSEDEQWTLEHERCHRIQDQEGWKAAAPKWAALPARFRTHAAINQALIKEGYLKP